MRVLDIGIVAHEAVEVRLAQDEQPAIGLGAHVGLSRLAADQRHLAEHIAAAERNVAVAEQTPPPPPRQ